jgi:hypothetical protein
MLDNGHRERGEMNVISPGERKRKYQRRKKWKVREAERSANKPTDGAELIYFKNMVTCRLCTSEISLKDLGQEIECFSGIKTLNDKESAWWTWYCRSGWERIEVRYNERGNSTGRLNVTHYLCRSCKDTWGEEIYDYIGGRLTLL